MIRDATRVGEIRESPDKIVFQRIVDEVEIVFTQRFGDEWEVYKFTLPGFFSTPVVVKAIKRIVSSIPQIDMDEDKYWDAVGNHYSFEFAKVLRQVIDQEFAELTERSENRFNLRMPIRTKH